jgi:hypothetical protein
MALKPVSMRTFVPPDEIKQLLPELPLPSSATVSGMVVTPGASSRPEDSLFEEVFTPLANLRYSS